MARKFFARSDLILIVGLLALSAVLLLWPKGAGQTVRIIVDGSESRYRLSEDRSISLVSEGIGLEVSISGGAVSVVQSTCPDQVCVRTGPIDKEGMSIVCLPAKVAVEILGEDGRIDAVAG